MSHTNFQFSSCIPSHLLAASILLPSLLTTGCGGGEDSGTPSEYYSPTQYISWAGSVNGTFIHDKNDESFKAISSSGQIITKSGTQLTGLKVSGSRLLYNGSQIGYIGFAAAQGGGQLAQMYCSNGEYLDIILNSASWQYKCNGVTSNGSSTNDSSPGNVATRSFITWTGSANGLIVLDATDERFRFYADSKCIFSDNTQKEYNNFCLSGNSSTIYFNGNTYTVAKILSTTRQCIVGLITSDGYFADIYTGPNKVETITTSSSRPTPC